MNVVKALKHVVDQSCVDRIETLSPDKENNCRMEHQDDTSKTQVAEPSRKADMCKSQGKGRKKGWVYVVSSVVLYMTTRIGTLILHSIYM